MSNKPTDEIAAAIIEAGEDIAEAISNAGDGIAMALKDNRFDPLDRGHDIAAMLDLMGQHIRRLAAAAENFQP